MTLATLTDVFAFVLVGASIVNAFFAFDGARLYFGSRSRSPILLAFLVIELAIWLTGVFVAWISSRFLLDLPPLPLGGLGLGVVLVVLALLPGYIFFAIRRAASADRETSSERDVTRDAIRDVDRDTGRDAERDPRRDTLRDVARDDVRDPARDAEQDA